MTLRDNIVTRAMEAGARLTVRSALNPILWLCALVTVPSLAVASFLSVAPTWLIALAFTPVGMASFGFLYLLLFDRDKLQSESFQLRKQTLELIEEKGMQAIDADTVEVITNPDLPALPRNEPEGLQ